MSKRASPAPRGRASPTLTADTHSGGIGFVALFLYGFLRGGGDRLFVRVLWQTTIPPNYFFAVYNSNQPLGLAWVPGNIDLIRAHTRLLCAPLLYHSSGPW